MTSAEEYVCTLDEKSLKRAKEELNEDPKNRLGAVETFRKWILEQPHIKCPTDTAFLLLFLRTRYFAQLEARELLEKFLSRRAKLSKWFRDLDTTDPKVQAVINDGLILYLPERDDEGRRVIVFRPGKVDVSEKIYTFSDIFRALACVFDYLYLMDETTCVNGTVSFTDLGGYSMKIHNSQSLEDRRDFIQTWQGSYPVRIKAMHLYNAGAMIDLIFVLLRFSMSEKMQKRLKNHSQVLESVYKDIPMRCLPVEYLPDDYKGPNAGTEKQILGKLGQLAYLQKKKNENMKRELTKPEVRDRIKYLSSDKFGIDESRRPKDAAAQASFRKLNID